MGVTDKKIWISAEAILDAITWSNLPKGFTEEESRHFKAYHDGKMVASECCDLLGLKHSYYFSASDPIEQPPEHVEVTFILNTRTQ